ncbi:MAG TPA: aspartate aminotransferase family protein [Candidatus Merdenecus merdavium]|nr:aspartate aminotransferase family protein [Candidatus Merdenecus merdavium]
MNPYMDRGEEVILHTYNRYPVVLDRGEGVYLYDVDHRKYLDFASGIGVYSLGYSNETFKHNIKEQVDKLTHTSNLYYNVPAIEAAEKLIHATKMSKVFFTNSGTEAIEGAIKVARKYAFNKTGNTEHEIIAMEHSFHGRSLGALSVTGNPAYQEAFKPLIGGIQFAVFNDIESVKEKVNDKTCAILLETIQGEGGIYPADECFLKEIEKICKERDILLILDEIQCGMGRTGTMFAYESYGITPDILTTAKALGNGLPVGAFVLNEKTAKASLVPGDHGTTYGGNPLACAAVSSVLSLYEDEKILKNVQKISKYFEKQLDKLVDQYEFIEERRGKGLMQGLVIKERLAGDIVKRALEEGLILITAGGNVLRFLPPLIITEADVDTMIKLLKKSF